MKTQFLFLVFLFSALMCGAQTPWNGTVAEAYDGGDGTPGNPYQITTAEQLALLAQQTNNGTGGDAYYILTSDIILNDGDSLLWTPIGSVGVFTGVFDGNGHIISGLYENGQKISGLFAVTESATIKNTRLENATVLEYEQAYVYTAIGGILIGKAKNTNILDCSVDGVIEIFSSKPSGGVVGQYEVDLNDTIFLTNCINFATVTENNCTGGIAGKTVVNNGNLVIDNCVNKGYINGWTFSGGMVGNGDFIIKNCNNFGEIISEGTAGGMAGQGGLSCSIVYCFNHESGKVTGGMNTGGIIGTAIYTVMSCCGNAALLTGVNEDEIMVGGISGADGTIYNCFNRGDLTAVYTGENPLLIQMGGISSTPPNDEYIRNVYNAGTIIKPTNTNIQSKWYGYIVPAIFSDTIISNCYWRRDELITEYVWNVTTNSWVHLPFSSYFNQGATPSSWVIGSPQYGTTDLLEALNAGAMDECVWVEDTEGINGGYPIPRPKTYDVVADNVVENPFDVYPNPTNGVIYVETVCTPSLQGQTEYRITNLMGQTIQTGSLHGENQQIDVSSLHRGMYFITVGGTTVKFMKQ